VLLEAQLKKPADRQETQRELDLMKRLGEALENEKPIRDVVKSQAEEKAVKSFAFLSLKPHVVVLNCDENEADLPTDPIAGATALRLSAKIEEEMAQLSEADRAEFLGELNLAALARDRLIQACYRKLNLISMFTVDYRECRAWPLPAGTDSLTAADQIHSDIARGFIRGEIMAYEDVFAAGGDEKAVKAAGKFRLEGKQYVIKDGDIVHFRFNI